MLRRILPALAGLALAVLCLPSIAQQPPFAGGGAMAGATDPAVDKLKAAAAKLEKQLKAKPKDAKLKMQTAEANYKAGHAMMFSAPLPPRVKYRGALVHFRRALELNPKHKLAAEEKKTIEDIYTQMGMPVPK